MTGTVDVSGQNVTWTGGSKFPVCNGNCLGSWQNQPITVCGANTTVTSVTDDQHLIIAANLGTRSGCSYEGNNLLIRAFHGYSYLPQANSVAIGAQLSAYAQSIGDWSLNLATGELWAGNDQACPATAHSIGFVGDGSGHFGLFEAVDAFGTVNWYFVQFPNNACSPDLGQWPSTPDIYLGFDFHPSGVRQNESGLPWLGLWGIFSSYYPLPPVTSYPTVTHPYEGEIDVSKWDGASLTWYRFVHDYNAGGNYINLNSALSPDRCWAGWNSNWLGNAGNDGRGTCSSSTPQYCRYDVFVTHLCN